MTSFERPRRLAELTPEVLRALLADMNAKPGWYASGEMHRWYVRMCEEDNLIPVGPRKFGTTLRELGYKPSLQRVHGRVTRGWFMSARALRGLPPREVAQ